MLFVYIIAYISSIVNTYIDRLNMVLEKGTQVL